MAVSVTAMLHVEASVAGEELRLAPLFTDNMVLQQESRAPLWGTGTPGAAVRVTAQWGSDAEAVVAPDGSWMLTLLTPAAGGPFEVTVRSSDTSVVLHNVLTGEVWLCSGQSNMEMPLEGWPPGDTVQNAAEEIRTSTFPRIRLFTVTRAFAASPSKTCEGAWVESSPRSTPGFSATAYFFGRMLHERLNVPIGLIHASWGGTPVEAWMSVDTLRGVTKFAGTLRKIAESADSMRALETWRLRYPALSVADRPTADRWKDLSFGDSLCALPGYRDTAWGSMRLPGLWESSDLGNFDGVVWFRKRVQIPAAWVGRDLALELGPIDDMDITYANGERVGSHEAEGFWKADRVYRIPAGVVRDTVLSLAVRVVDHQGGGGMFGDPERFRVRPDSHTVGVSLAGLWKYQPVAEYRAKTFYVFGPAAEEFRSRPHPPFEFSAHSPAALYNGMISPLIPFRVRGAIWYQGEANTGDPTMYRTLFPQMIRNWRSAFNSAQMPFYYVQIAPFDYGPSTPSEFLREAQLLSLDVGNAGMAVTLDIGNPGNIHPANKQEVGRRLALWALAKTYGVELAYSGPLFRSMKKEKDRIVLSFDDAGSKLVLREGGAGSGFQIAGADRVFRDARVEVWGKTLAVWHPDVARPEAVRYAFSNTPPSTLFNSDGLPAPSFRTDRWER